MPLSDFLQFVLQGNGSFEKGMVPFEFPQPLYPGSGNEAIAKLGQLTHELVVFEGEIHHVEFNSESKSVRLRCAWALQKYYWRWKQTDPKRTHCYHLFFDKEKLTLVENNGDGPWFSILLRYNENGEFNHAELIAQRDWKHLVSSNHNDHHFRVNAKLSDYVPDDYVPVCEDEVLQYLPDPIDVQ